MNNVWSAGTQSYYASDPSQSQSLLDHPLKASQTRINVITITRLSVPARSDGSMLIQNSQYRRGVGGIEHEQYFFFTTVSPLGSTTSIRCCCHPDRIEAATAPMLKSRVSTLFKHTLGSYTAIKDKEIWEGTSNPSLHYPC